MFENYEYIKVTTHLEWISNHQDFLPTELLPGSRHVFEFRVLFIHVGITQG